MKKLVLFLAIIISILLVSCGNTNKNMSSQENSSGSLTDEKTFNYDKNIEENKEISSEDKQSSTVISEAEGRKIVENGQLNIKTTEFDKSISTLEKIINSYGGYIENSNVYSDGINEDNYKDKRRAEYTIRIPSNKFKDFISSSKDIGVITSKSTNANDITSSYFDKEARLKVLQAQEERYLELLKSSGSMSEMLEVEKALSDVRYDIETLTGTLNEMNELVNLSTINIYLSEVEKIAGEKEYPVTFIEKIKDGFLNSIYGVIALLSAIIVFIISAIPYLILLIIIVLIVMLILRKIKKNKAK